MYVLSLLLLAGFALRGLRGAQAASGSAELSPVIILDAGHGGVDGGSSTAEGVRESDINLEITLKTDAVLGLLGEQTLLTRATDTDLSSSDAQTIAQKKVSDIRARTALVNDHPGSLLLSIHQNIFPQEKYHGAQMFFNGVGDSEDWAKRLQKAMNTAVDSTNTRQAKAAARSIYLMSHTQTPGLLAECGFLSNQEEAARLQTQDYQKRLAVALAVITSNFAHREQNGI